MRWILLMLYVLGFAVAGTIAGCEDEDVDYVWCCDDDDDDNDDNDDDNDGGADGDADTDSDTMPM